MSFTMFVTWVLVGVVVGVLAGVVMKREGYGLKKDVIFGLVGSIGLSWIFRAVGMFPAAGIVAMAVVAFIGAVIPIVAQRKFWPTQSAGEEKADKWWRWGLGAAVVAVVAWMTLGPVPQPAATAAVIEERTYTVKPPSVKMQAGIVTGEVTAMKIAERVEKGSDRIITPAKLTATITLTNTSANQTLRLLEGKLLYIDAQGQPIKLEDARTEPTLKFATYGSERLDPGQEATQTLDVEFPAEALKAKRLKEIRLEFAYIPSPYREETVNFAVSIGAGK
jgi:uncharacterized membrane protein YeaQ/YmgE (transglycosylase-associated protein family)